MNPLSPFSYHRRNKRRALLLAALICLATLGVCVMVRLLDFLFEQTETTERYLTRVSVVRPLRGTIDPGVAAQIRTHPDVAQVILQNHLSIGVPLNTSGGFPVFGIPEADLESLMDVCDLRLKEGRFLRARTNEIMLSEEIAETLGLQLGDPLGRSVNEKYHSYIPTTMVLVGTLETDPASGGGSRIRLGLVSLEYLNSHEVYVSQSPSLFIIPKAGRKAAMDRFLETSIPSTMALVSTHRGMQESIQSGLLIFRSIFAVVDIVVAFVMALVVGAINRIALNQRTSEFGLLHAVGHSRKLLARRLTLETAVVAGAGWLAGLVFSWLLFAWLKHYLFSPLFDMELWRLAPIWFSVPIPLAVVLLSSWSTMRTLARLDAVSVIDRGQLAMERGAPRRNTRRSPTPQSSSRPLSSWNFYRRHLRRGLVIVLTMALMIVGVAFPALLFAPSIDINKALSEHLHHISLVSPRLGSAVDAGVMAQIRTHPTVASVVPAIKLYISIGMEPLFRGNIDVYGVAEDDLQPLVRSLGLQLAEGRFPLPRSNEIVLTEAVAVNRGLLVGDKVGRPAFEHDYGIPTEMVVVGILSNSELNRQAKDIWLGFASYEYLISHETYSSRPRTVLVFPVVGRKAQMDAWLEKSMASERTTVRTYDTWQEDQRDLTQMLLLVFGAIEGTVAVVAAFALAILSYLFFNQRREEFGILHALGHGRRWLVWRTVGETVTIVAMAWTIGAAVCLAGLGFVWATICYPNGLDLDVLNPVPWLFTLPMPLVVVTIGAGLVAWMLAKLDPVSVIERRS